MSDVEVLVLNGSPGSGKSTMANALSEELRNMNQVHAVIDVDELARVYPEIHGDMIWKNLAAIWPNYKAIPDIKVIIPVLVEDQFALGSLKNAIPCNRLTICELVAPLDLMKSRVSKREPNEYWQRKLRDQVEVYNNMTKTFNDFQINTDSLTPEQLAKDIVIKLGWSLEK